MARSGTTFAGGPELLIELRRGNGRPLRAQLEDGLREAARSGLLPAGSRLPATRALAGDLGVSRRLVVDAYAQLLAEGYLTARPGAGTYVSDAATAASAPPRCAASSATGTAAGVNASPSSGRPRVISSGVSPDAISSCCEAGTHPVMYPAPARMLARAAMRGAPVRPREPPATITCPLENLVLPAPLRGSSPSTVGLIRPMSLASGAPRGTPMSTTRTSPACALPGAIHSPGLAA